MGLPSALGRNDDSLIRELYPSLRRFAAVVAPIEVDPDDLVQDALYRVLRGGSIDRLDHPAAYLRKTMVNLASNHRRSLGRRRRALYRLRSDLDMRPVYPSDLADLDWLTPRARAVLYLHDVEGREFDEIGRLVGCSAVAARAEASRSRRKLASILRDEGVANA